MLDIRHDFPFTKRRAGGMPLVYLDSAATTQKPQCVLDAVMGLYESGISNVHRSATFLADEVTEAFEASRLTVARFLRAQPEEIVFTASATYAINFAAQCLRAAGPLRVLTSTLEHHSNLLPWTNAAINYINWTPSGILDLADLERKLAARPTLVAVNAASNFLGSIQPLHRIGSLCRAAGVPLLVDASQSIAHLPLDVQAVDCDFAVFSGHKTYGPGGTGVLYIRKSAAAALEPHFVGGTMVKEVHAGEHKWNDLPLRFEPGTPNIEGVIGLGAAVDYLDNLGFDRIASHEASLSRYARERLATIPGIRLLGPAASEPSVPLVSFHIPGLDSGMIAKTLSLRSKIIVRSGFLCAQPAHDALGVAPSVRASFAVYNTIEDINLLAKTLEDIQHAAS